MHKWIEFANEIASTKDTAAQFSVNEDNIINVYHLWPYAINNSVDNFRRFKVTQITTLSLSLPQSPSGHYKPSAPSPLSNSNDYVDNKKYNTENTIQCFKAEKSQIIYKTFPWISCSILLFISLISFGGSESSIFHCVLLLSCVTF